MQAIRRSADSMLPDEAALTDVLPTDRLGPTGRPIGDLRDELYLIPNAANALHVIGLWVQSVGVLTVAAWWGHPVGWVAAFLLMGRAFARFAILGHEAAHRLLFSNKTVNDRVGKWLVAYPAFVPLDAYRRSHMAHHKEEFGPNEPDLALYSGYPITAASWHRKLLPRRRRELRLEEPEAAAARGALDHGQTGGATHPRLAAGAVRRSLGRPRALVDLPGVLVVAMDDRVAGPQPAASGRRARRHDRVGRSAPDHPPRSPVVVHRASGWCRSTPAGIWHTTSTSACRSPSCRSCITSLNERAM
ncbi:MAG: fatty acid desaturase [Microthrixaceae bacterium]